jgi:ATP-binding cassette, subfamily B, bacterial
MASASPGGAPAARANPSFRERMGALRNLPPFLRQIWAASKPLTVASLGLRMVRALLPVAMLYVGKLIIDEVVRLVGAGIAFDGLAAAWASGLLEPLLGLLLLEFALAIVSDLLGRLVGYADSLLSELFTNATSVRLMEHAATLDLEDFEDPDLQDKLDRARRQTMGRMNLMGMIFGQVQDAITVVSFAVGLLVYAPWLILLLAIALVPAFIGESHFNALGYSLNFAWTPERRQLEYVRQMGASVETAKEVKIFNLHRFLIARYRELADGFYRANRALAR